MLSEQEIDAAEIKFAWVNLNCTEHRNAFARAIESAACAPLLARIAELELEVKALTQDREVLALEGNRLERELEEARKDAERFVKFTSGKANVMQQMIDAICSKTETDTDWWRSAIDAAIKEQT